MQLMKLYSQVLLWAVASATYGKQATQAHKRIDAD
jgi:hypothetical protein